jgi:hypothetical protein
VNLPRDVAISRHAAERYAERVWRLEAPHPNVRVVAAMRDIRNQLRFAKLDREESAPRKCNIYKLVNCYASITDGTVVTIMSMYHIDRYKQHRTETKEIKRRTKRAKRVRPVMGGADED